MLLVGRVSLPTSARLTPCSQLYSGRTQRFALESCGTTSGWNQMDGFGLEKLGVGHARLQTRGRDSLESHFIRIFLQTSRPQYSGPCLVRQSGSCCHSAAKRGQAAQTVHLWLGLGSERLDETRTFPGGIATHCPYSPRYPREAVTTG
jgi:hypothetical protein